MRIRKAWHAQKHFHPVQSVRVSSRNALCLITQKQFHAHLVTYEMHLLTWLLFYEQQFIGLQNQFCDLRPKKFTFSIAQHEWSAYCYKPGLCPLAAVVVVVVTCRDFMWMLIEPDFWDTLHVLNIITFMWINTFVNAIFAFLFSDIFSHTGMFFINVCIALFVLF